jgi:hypothetical protein
VADDTEVPSIAVAVERLRGITEAGFARLNGRLDLALQRADRADADLQQLRTDHDEDMGEMRADIEELKRARWPLPALGTLIALAALIVAVFGTMTSK